MAVPPFVPIHHLLCREVPTWLALLEKWGQLIPAMWALSDASMLGDARGSFSNLSMHQSNVFWNTSEVMAVPPYGLTHHLLCQEVPKWLALSKTIGQLIPKIWSWSDALDVRRCQRKLLGLSSCINKVFSNTPEAMAVPPYVPTHHLLCQEVPTWLAISKTIGQLIPAIWAWSDALDVGEMQ